MSDAQINISKDVLNEGLGLITAAGYINNEGGQAVADAAEDLVGKGCKSLLVDLEGTRIINSIGVSILLEIMEKLMDNDGVLAFCNLTPTIAKTFEIMGLDQYARVYPDRDAAVSAFGDDASS